MCVLVVILESACCLGFQVQPIWCQWFELVDPVALSHLSQVCIRAPHLLYHHDSEVFQRVAWGVSYWLLSSSILYVTSVSVEVNVEGVLCFSHVLLLASSASNYVDDVAGLACCCNSYMEGLTSGGAFECLSSPDVSACKATFATTWTAPLVWFVVCWL